MREIELVSYWIPALRNDPGTATHANLTIPRTMSAVLRMVRSRVRNPRLSATLIERNVRPTRYTLRRTRCKVSRERNLGRRSLRMRARRRRNTRSTAGSAARRLLSRDFCCDDALAVEVVAAAGIWRFWRVLEEHRLRRSLEEEEEEEEFAVVAEVVVVACDWMFELSKDNKLTGGVISPSFPSSSCDNAIDSILSVANFAVFFLFICWSSLCCCFCCLYCWTYLFAATKMTTRTESPDAAAVAESTILRMRRFVARGRAK